MKARYTGKTNQYLTNGKIYDAKEVHNEHGPIPLIGITNDEGDETVVATDVFEIIPE